MATVGDQIRSARQRRKWTQQQLADAVGVNIKTVDNWENGRSSPRNRLGAIEETLGMRLRDSPDDASSADPKVLAILRNPVFTDEEKASLITALFAHRKPPPDPPRQEAQAG